MSGAGALEIFEQILPTKAYLDDSAVGGQVTSVDGSHCVHSKKLLKSFEDWGVAKTKKIKG